ncbi:exported hypothetical protein [Hyphomicrobiales bacterium]|nr:exported hypothetical protein [Hyphomicrobiales bacterium]CAH1696906.1 exported hypothetical protein [Hyphomicrobiales bacterium]
MVDLTRRIVMSAAFAMGAVAAPRAIVEPPLPMEDPALTAVNAARTARIDAAKASFAREAAVTAVRDAGADILPCVQVSTMKGYEDGAPVVWPIVVRSHAEIDAFYSQQLHHVEMFGRKALENMQARKAAHHAAVDAEIERLRPIHEAAGYRVACDEVKRSERRATDTFIEAMTTEPQSPAGLYALWQLISDDLGDLPDVGSSICEGIDTLDKALRAFLGVDEPKLHDA